MQWLDWHQRCEVHGCTQSRAGMELQIPIELPLVRSVTCQYRNNGEVAERPKALDWNFSNIFTGVRGFESHPLRHSTIRIKRLWVAS